MEEEEDQNTTFENPHIPLITRSQSLPSLSRIPQSSSFSQPPPPPSSSSSPPPPSSSSSPPPPPPAFSFKNPRVVLKACFLFLMFFSLSILWISLSLIYSGFAKKFIDNEPDLGTDLIQYLLSRLVFSFIVITLVHGFKPTTCNRWLVLNFKLLRVLIDATCVLLYRYTVVGPHYHVSDFAYLAVFGGQSLVDSTLAYVANNGFADALIITTSGFLNFSYFLRHWKLNDVLVGSSVIYGIMMVICVYHANVYPEYATSQPATSQPAMSQPAVSQPATSLVQSR